ncbi:hypothetical protein THAOC_05481 [Thalassiosira oceanica]|uniref:SLC26A/SulP transporter domain-containing protein n=1 Tax=Thalassiosira oceanica TaxID=159749 RepID=K0TMS4_THAOC|nr:hypothetical protein THAOC_05481 [Thalassiosira oceanica]|eukprot:EJK72937.1 hypothetical protein THAOC_05481 [Thalassiosira oceanica]
MITSASGLCALLLHRLVNTNTVENTGIMFVPYAVGFAGVLQIAAAIFQLGRLVSNFPAPVVVGMVNAVAILALVLQCRYIKVFPLSEEEIENGWEIDGEDKAVELEVNRLAPTILFQVAILAYYGKGIEFIQPWLTLAIYGAEAAAAFLISMFLPRLTTFLPATLISVLVVIAVEFGLARQFGVETPLIGDYGGSQVVAPWETILSPNANFDLPALDTFENWKIILGYGSALFVTSFTETAISLNVVDRLDESRGPGAMVLAGQGVANVVSSLFGGMSATGVVTMSVLADRTFGTTCLSTFLTGVLLFVFVSLAHPVIDYIPLSAVSGISIAMVCSFVQWRSLIALFTICMRSSTRDKLPPYYNITRTDVLLMLVTTAAALAFDFAAMGLFSLAVIIVVYARARACCRKEEKDEGIVHEGESLQCDESFPETDQRDEESHLSKQDSCDIGSVVLDAAEEAIFSVKT